MKNVNSRPPWVPRADPGQTSFHPRRTDLDTRQDKLIELAGLSVARGTKGGIGGAIVKGDGYVPCADGAQVYLNGGKDLATVLARVESAGGKVLVPKTKITDEIGYFAVFTDTEGNKVSLHSRA